MSHQPKVFNEGDRVKCIAKANNGLVGTVQNVIINGRSRKYAVKWSNDCETMVANRSIVAEGHSANSTAPRAPLARANRPSSSSNDSDYSFDTYESDDEESIEENMENPQVFSKYRYFGFFIKIDFLVNFTEKMV
jgi:hypothetical protein